MITWKVVIFYIMYVFQVLNWYCRLNVCSLKSFIPLRLWFLVEWHNLYFCHMNYIYHNIGKKRTQMITATFVYQRYMCTKQNCLQKRVKWHFWEELGYFYKETNNNCRQNVVFRSLLTRIIPPEIFLKVIFKTQKEVF